MKSEVFNGIFVGTQAAAWIQVRRSDARVIVREHSNQFHTGGETFSATDADCSDAAFSAPLPQGGD